MGVSRCKIKGLEYWKVYRDWGEGSPVQRYFRITDKNERESYKRAVEEDESLRARQRAYLARQVFDLHYHIMPDGKLRGVRRVTVRRKGRKPTEAFQIRIKLPWEERPVFNSVSIDKHGVDGAFARVVEWYCDVYGFDKRSQMRSALRECVDAYKSALTIKTLPERVTAHENEPDWVAQMEREIKAFKARDKKVISGR